MAAHVEKPWAREATDVARELGVEPQRGLDAPEAKRRREEHGDNEIARKESESAWTILLNQFKSVIVLLLGSAAILTFALGRWIEGVSISVVVVVNAVIGFVTELRAVRSMEALEKLSETSAKVRRDGRVTTVRSAEVVPGDVVVFEAGDTVGADMRLIEAARLQTDESTLTGESVPVTKSTEPVDEDAPLAERASMLLKGTAITRGSGEGVVTATGMQTELGAISADVQEASETTTKLEERLDQLGRSFIWLTVILSAIVVPVGWWRDKDLVLVVETAIALAVAAIPEGLPIVLTVALARGMRRMARRNALINRLAAVETLGSVTLIATDKTGTLTENQMTVRELVVPGRTVNIGGEGLDLEGAFRHDGHALDVHDDAQLSDVVRVGVLCGNAELSEDDGEVCATGDPMEAALLVAGRKAGLKRSELLEELPEEKEVAFDPDLKMMATVHRRDGEYLFAIKGAAEAVLGVCDDVRTAEGREALDEKKRESWAETAKSKADEGLRVLAAAQKTTQSVDDEPYEALTFLGLFAFEDPPRSDVKVAIEAAHDAGIHTLMVTGDQLETARSIAKQLDMAEPGDDDRIEAVEGKELASGERADDAEQERIASVTVFSRVTPRQKLDLVELHQSRGEIVAMTGDGVNDAPALERADIGIAMGQRGTQVAREAADVILEDDAFATIVDAIKQGRVIFNNLRQFVLFLLTVSLSMIIAVFTASMFDLPIPVLPLQILFLNAVTHVFPALALGMGEGAPGVMRAAPREKDEPILGAVHWWFIAVHAALIAVAGLGGVVVAPRIEGVTSGEAQTVGFLAVAFAQLWHVFNVRSDRSGVFVNEITKNRYVWWAVGLSFVLTLAVVYVPPVATAMKVEVPGLEGWVLALALSLVPLLGNLAYVATGAGARIGAPQVARG